MMYGEALQNNYETMSPLFIQNNELKPEDISQMFSTVNWSEEGSNAVREEEKSMGFFLDYLEDCFGKEYVLCKSEPRNLVQCMFSYSLIYDTE